MLETTAAVKVHTVLPKDAAGVSVGLFRLRKAAYVDLAGNVHVGLMTGSLDLTNRRLLRCEFDGKDMAPTDAVIMLAAEGALHAHPQVHAYANWGVNPASPDPFLARLGAVSVFYNELGFNGAERIFDFLERWGVMSFFSGKKFRALVDARAFSRVEDHSQVNKLLPFSNYARFIVRVRAFFVKNFAKYQKDFPGINGEALFIGTVLHSTEHSQFVHCTRESDFFNPVDLDMTAAVSEAVLVSRCAFSDELPLVHSIFNLKFKNSPHPLFRETYEMARKIDERLADAMDCCIVK